MTSSGAALIAGMAAFLAACPGNAVAQSSVLEGFVRDTAGRPVHGAEVVNLTTRERTTVSGAGRFVAAGLSAGPHLWLVRAIGYRPERLALTMAGTDTIEIEVVLGPLPQLLPELAVVVRGYQYRGRLAEAARRALASPAPASSFIGPQELERWAQHDLGNVLRRAGLAVGGDRVGCPRSDVRLRARRRPAVAVWLDGALIEESASFDVRTFPVRWFAAIEVYRSPVERPAQFDSPGSSCTILLWTH